MTLHCFVAVGADGHRHNQSHLVGVDSVDQLGQHGQEFFGLRARLGGEQLLGLVDRQDQRRRGGRRGRTSKGELRGGSKADFAPQLEDLIDVSLSAGLLDSAERGAGQVERFAAGMDCRG